MVGGVALASKSQYVYTAAASEPPTTTNSPPQTQIHIQNFTQTQIHIQISHKYIYKYHTNTDTNIKRAAIQQQPVSTNINKLTTSVKLFRLASLESAAAANPALLAFSKPSEMAVAPQISQWLVVHFFWDTESALVFDPLKLPGPLYHH